MKFCSYFYDYLYVFNSEGAICICPWMRPSENALGNLITGDIDSLYNSEYANHLRSTMDDQSFRYCRKEACPFLQNKSLPDITPEEYEARKKARYYPTFINLAYDNVCNQFCETCRKEMFKPSSKYKKQMDIMYEKLAPYIDTATTLSASGHGDPFASKYMMMVLEKLGPKNPSITIRLETNGVFFDEAHWDRIKHLGNFYLDIVVTSNSFDEFTYNHISRGGDYKRLMQNLNYMSQLRRDGKLNNLSHSFVIQDRNFREIPTFIKRSFQDYAFDCVVLKPVYQWKALDDEVYWFKDVLNPRHPYHQEYLEIMQDPALKDPRVYHFGGNTVHEGRPYPGAGAISSVGFPYSKIKKDSKIIIYGVGAIVREFVRQLQETQYCHVVRWIDKTNDDERVSSPDFLFEMPADAFDTVLLATKSPVFMEEMRSVLKAAGVTDERIVSYY